MLRDRAVETRPGTARARTAKALVETGPRGRGWARSVIFTAGLLGLISLSVEQVDASLLFALIGSVAGLALALHYFFPGSLFFSVALANLLGVYASIFVFFVEDHFGKVDAELLPLGFLGPPFAFLIGALSRRHSIRDIIASRRLREEAHFARVLSWLVPVFTIGALTFLIPPQGIGSATLDGLFLAAMAAIAGIVFLASHDVAAFLLDTGLLFEEFFTRAVRLIVPAFAFLTFYSLVVIVFASIYSALDHLTHVPHFRVDGVVRELSFAESVYFSLATLSTVGFGDIAPVVSGVRVLVAIEIVCGILLLLFGVNEIVHYSSEAVRREHGLRRPGPDDLPP
jgi:voltage-gated potassium channel